MSLDHNKYFRNVTINNQDYFLYDLAEAAKDIGINLESLPYTLRILLENTLRCNPQADLSIFKNWLRNKKSTDEIDFMPARVLMQDYTGIPAIVDLAAMRDAMKVLGDSPLKVNPLIPVDLVIDHSVQVDSFGSKDSFNTNVTIEAKRNNERYKFLKWGQESFDNFKVVPPGTGICHQVNLEYLAKVVWSKTQDGKTILYPDTVVGTDSHTTMINGLSVLGWGVGGIEAEAAMLGQPVSVILPEVIGVRLVGKLQDFITATDLVLTVTQILRKKQVVGKFVEFFGQGLDNLGLADRATLANMAPEYGATCGFFPIDDETIKYLQLTARPQEHIALVKAYAQHQKLWRNETAIEYTEIIEIDLNLVETSMAGPRRPQDKLALANIQSNFHTELPGLAQGEVDINTKFAVNNSEFTLKHGDVVIAAITSCTNTSNPNVMIAAGLLAKKAYDQGLHSKPWVKTSLAPGSQIVTEYLKISGLDKYLEYLGFYLAGYGCTTCIGNSGPLAADIEQSITSNKIVASSVLSGNRNFEGRIHPLVRANYLASPPLVVAYAIAGSVNINLAADPLGVNAQGKNIYLKDIWPSAQEIQTAVQQSINAELFASKYKNVFLGDENWQNIKVPLENTYEWDDTSTYIKNPSYFENSKLTENKLKEVVNAQILAVLGDSITTDHISPAGNINLKSPAGKYLLALGVAQADFNSYGARRGNHEVMIRGTFANIRIKNELCDGAEGGFTINQLTKTQENVYDAAMYYKERSIPLVIFAGKEYGTGSSRDWAAKGTQLLGVKAIIAESFERIHRSNLVGMGVFPLTFTDNLTRKDLSLDGSEKVSIIGINDQLKPNQLLKCLVARINGKIDEYMLKLQVYTDSEISCIAQGSIMHKVLFELNNQHKK